MIYCLCNKTTGTNERCWTNKMQQTPIIIMHDVQSGHAFYWLLRQIGAIIPAFLDRKKLLYLKTNIFIGMSYRIERRYASRRQKFIDMCASSKIPVRWYQIFFSYRPGFSSSINIFFSFYALNSIVIYKIIYIYIYPTMHF